MAPKQSERKPSTASSALAKPDENYNGDSRQTQRSKQIAIGKDTRGYRIYRRKVPRSARIPGTHLETPPVSPRTNAELSKRVFEACLREWRRFLHEYDGVESEGESSTESEDEPSPPQATELIKRMKETELWVKTKKSRRKPRKTSESPEPEAPEPPPEDTDSSLSAAPSHDPASPLPPPPLPTEGDVGTGAWRCVSDKHRVRQGPSREMEPVGTVVRDDTVQVKELYANGGELWGRLGWENGFPEGSWTLVFEAPSASYLVEIPPPPPPPPGPTFEVPLCLAAGVPLPLPMHLPVDPPPMDLLPPAPPCAPPPVLEGVVGEGDTPFSSLEEHGIFLTRPAARPPSPVEEDEWVGGFPSAPLGGMRRSASEPNLFDKAPHLDHCIAQTPAH